MLGVLSDYIVDAGYDEMFESPGVPRPHYREIVEFLQSSTSDDLAERQRRADMAFLNAGITFTVYSEGAGVERIFPFDLIPRVLPAHEWRTIEAGLKQRVLALNAFLQDVYNDGNILEAGVVPSALVFDSPGYQPAMRGFTPPGGVWTHIAGIDLVRDAGGTFYVLEDNVRTPSGVSYVIENREVSERTMPRIFSNGGVRPVSGYASMLHAALHRCGGGDPSAVLTPGPYNSAYFEHAFLAKQMGIQLVEGRDLKVHDARLCMRTTRGLKPIGGLYRRVDDDFLDPLNFNPESTLGVAGLFDIYRSGRVAVINAIGTGIADDKSVYPFVPEMIRFYLGEDPILSNVPTYHAADATMREHILANLRDLVVKPTNASGGYGVVVGPTAEPTTLERLRDAIELNPRGYVAQPLVRLSTCPTVIGGEYVPRRVDLRPFVLYDGVEPWVLPGGLTRVALREGSFVVNSSQGGGSKDTWVVDAP